VNCFQIQLGAERSSAVFKQAGFSYVLVPVTRLNQKGLLSSAKCSDQHVTSFTGSIGGCGGAVFKLIGGRTAGTIGPGRGVVGGGGKKPSGCDCRGAAVRLAESLDPGTGTIPYGANIGGARGGCCGGGINPPNLIAAASGCWGGIPHGGSPDIALLYSKQFNNYRPASAK
jgi:hypothetical protein